MICFDERIKFWFLLLKQCPCKQQFQTDNEANLEYSQIWKIVTIGPFVLCDICSNRMSFACSEVIKASHDGSQKKYASCMCNEAQHTKQVPFLCITVIILHWDCNYIWKYILGVFWYEGFYLGFSLASGIPDENHSHLYTLFMKPLSSYQIKISAECFDLC